jgi:hypothetical protein
MDRTQRFVACGTILSCALALAACKNDEPATATPPPEAAPDIVRSAPMAGVSTPTPEPRVLVTAVDLGNAVGDEQRVARPMTSFSARDTIHASVSTRAADTGNARARLMARWTYQDGQVVDELGEEYDFSGEGRTVFRISNPDGWPTGTYKLEILLDDEVVQTRQFEVR